MIILNVNFIVIQKILLLCKKHLLALQRLLVGALTLAQHKQHCFTLDSWHQHIILMVEGLSMSIKLILITLNSSFAFDFPNHHESFLKKNKKLLNTILFVLKLLIKNSAGYQCMPNEGTGNRSKTAKQRQRGLMYQIEYQTNTDSPLSANHDLEAVCAVCEAAATDVLMIPGRNTCVDGYRRLYQGWLMTQQYEQQKSEYICVDLSSTGQGTPGDQNGGLV